MDLTQALEAVDCVEMSLSSDLLDHANFLLDALYCGDPQLRDRVELLMKITGVTSHDLIQAGRPRD